MTVPATPIAVPFATEVFGAAAAAPAGRAPTPADRVPTPPSALETLRSPARWPIPAGLTMLNHGSYGICPEHVAARQAELRRLMDQDPPTFFLIHLERLSDRARDTIARLVRAPFDGVSLVPNATFAVATCLHSIDWQPGDEVVMTDQEYTATRNELDRLVKDRGIVVRTANVPVPLLSAKQVVDNFAALLTPRTRLVLVSHIISTTSIIMPVEALVAMAHERGIETLVDGAHTPGQIPLDIQSLNPTYYAASCHKWLCTPKGSGFFYAAAHRRAHIQPRALSCRVHNKRADRAAFLCDFDYVGTGDYTANLVVPDAVQHLAAQLPGGFDAVMDRNRDLVSRGAALIARRCGLRLAAPDDMAGTMRTLLLPSDPLPQRPKTYEDPLWDRLTLHHRIQVPVWTLQPANQRLMRVSAHLFNTLGDYEKLAEALAEELAAEAAMR